MKKILKRIHWKFVGAFNEFVNHMWHIKERENFFPQSAWKEMISTLFWTMLVLILSLILFSAGKAFSSIEEPTVMFIAIKLCRVAHMYRLVYILYDSGSAMV